MAYTADQLFAKLEKADAAGDAEAAKVIADEIRQLQSAETEPSLEDKARSYGYSALSGLTALPKGAFQLGANVGDYLFGDEGMELTEGAKATAEQQEVAVPDKYRGYFSNEVNRLMEEDHAVKQALMEKAGREGFDWTEMAGMMPAGFMKVGSIPFTGKAAVNTALAQKVIPSIEKLPPWAKNVAQGAKSGAVYGASMPVTGEGDYFDKKGSQAAIGSALGGAIPIAAIPIKAGARWLGEVVKPMIGKYGKNLDIDKFIRENFRGASEAEKAHIHKALQGAYPDETAGQALARYNRMLRKQGVPDEVGGSVIATEKALAKTHEGAASQLRTKPNMQQIEREQTLEAIAKSPWERKLMERIVKADDVKKYGEAFKQSIKADPELARIASNPYFKDQIKTAGKIMSSSENKGSLTEFLHNVKLGLDKSLSIKSGSEHALSAGEKKATLSLKKELIDWIKRKNPAYDEARITHAANMQPLSRANVGKEMLEALVNPGGKEASATFQSAMRSAPRTIKKATGQNIYDDLGQVLKKEQKTGVDIVSESLKNKRMYEELGGGAQSLLPNLSTEATPQLVHILYRPVVFANAMLKSVGRDMGPEYRRILSEKMSNPEVLRKIIEKPESDAAQKVVRILNYMATTQSARQAGE